MTDMVNQCGSKVMDEGLYILALTGKVFRIPLLLSEITGTSTALGSAHP
jgi:hypothetical protein